MKVKPCRLCAYVEKDTEMKIETGWPKYKGAYWVKFSVYPVFWNGNIWEDSLAQFPYEEETEWIYIGKKPSFKKVKGK